MGELIQNPCKEVGLNSLPIGASSSAFDSFRKTHDTAFRAISENIDIYKGTKEELQDIIVGNKGYLVTPSNDFGDTYILEYVEILKVSDDKVIVSNHRMQSKTMKISGITGVFFKTQERFEAVQARENYRSITSQPIDDFITALQISKNKYPEIWL